MATADFEKYFLQATESAAIAASKWIGKGDGKAADGAAVEAMRAVLTLFLLPAVWLSGKAKEMMHQCYGLVNR